MSKSITLNVRGIVIPTMKIMRAARRGRCDRTRQWFEPGTVIAFKHRDQLTDEMAQALFGDGPVYHVTVVLTDKTVPRPVTEDSLPF